MLRESRVITRKFQARPFACELGCRWSSPVRHHCMIPGLRNERPVRYGHSERPNRSVLSGPRGSTHMRTRRCDRSQVSRKPRHLLSASSPCRKGAACCTHDTTTGTSSEPGLTARPPQTGRSAALREKPSVARGSHRTSAGIGQKYAGVKGLSPCPGTIYLSGGIQC